MLEIRTNHVTLLCCSLITSAIYAYKPQPQPQTSTDVWLPNRPLSAHNNTGDLDSTSPTKYDVKHPARSMVPDCCLQSVVPF
ncbi:hypothetical protein DFH94DRAFT_779334 [Russula ochroleuca]|uniref:Secreted protein n=1 Tax=Russula ochroleuca TaxID=152965 RepID=A0A9P5MLA1_9AGAM|nr:hypothetical protein DFH94DRAFT_779334 [Russula ochroleuca]